MWFTYSTWGRVVRREYTLTAANQRTCGAGRLVLGRRHVIAGVYIYSPGKYLATELCIMQVQPAASFAWEVQRKGGKVAVFNVEASSGTSHADFFFEGGCEIELQRVLGINATVVNEEIIMG